MPLFVSVRLLHPSWEQINAFFIFSVPNNKSFQILKKEKFGNLINSFPEQKLILKNIDKRFQVKIYESNFFQKFNSFIDFFKSLDEIGAGTSNKEIDFKSIFRLRKYTFKKSIEIDYNINFYIIKKLEWTVKVILLQGQILVLVKQ